MDDRKLDHRRPEDEFGDHEWPNRIAARIDYGAAAKPRQSTEDEIKDVLAWLYNRYANVSSSGSSLEPEYWRAIKVIERLVKLTPSDEKREPVAKPSEPVSDALRDACDNAGEDFFPTTDELTAMTAATPRDERARLVR